MGYRYLRVRINSANDASILYRVIPRAFFARSPGGSTIMFRYYLLGGDTAAPSGLYSRLCHAFLVLNLTPNSRGIVELPA